jgi:cytoskeleton-associated protein 5
MEELGAGAPSSFGQSSGGDALGVEPSEQPKQAAAAALPDMQVIGVPVESSKAASVEPEFETVQDFTSEPLEARLASKDLNRRCSAYTELQANMERGNDPEAFAVFWKHLDVCIGETLPKGQDAALTALSKYLELSQDLEASDALPLVRRLLEHKSIDKPKMQLLVPPVILAVAEICEGPAVIKEMLDCLTGLEDAKKKVQGFFKKQVAFIIRQFYQMLSEFGAARISPKLGYVNVTIKYITDKDNLIREACYNTLVELSCWLGDISGAVQSMEEPQKKELMARVDKLGDEEKRRTQAKRLYRGEAQLVTDICDSGTVVVDKAASVPVTLDAYDMVEAVDAQKKLPRGWCISKVFSMEKWKEKHEYLQELSKILDVPRLVSCDFYASLAPSFARLFKTESNIPIMTEAAKCVGLMARGLRKDFERPARQLLPVALKRIVDKSVWKTNVLIDRVEQLLWSVPFDLLLEELRPHVASKSLFAKKEAMAFFVRSFDLVQVQQSSGDVAQKFLCPLAAAVLPNLDDADNTVRQEAARILALLSHRNPDSPDLGPHLLSKVPAARRNFFEEECRKLGKELGLPCEFLSGSGSIGLASAAAEADMKKSASSSSLLTRIPPAAEGRPESPLARGRAGSRPATPNQQRIGAGSSLKRTGLTMPRARGLALTPRSLQQGTADAATTCATSSKDHVHADEEADSARATSSREGATSSHAQPAELTPAPPSCGESALIEAMAAEIRSLNAKVQELEAQQADQDLCNAAAPSRQRAGHGGAAAQPQATHESSLPSRLSRPATPPPQRARSTDRSGLAAKQAAAAAAAAAADAQVEKRLSSSTSGMITPRGMSSGPARRQGLQSHLHALSSKNKRSVICSLAAISEGFDRQAAFQILRSQKDVVAIVKMFDDKDGDLRKAALQIIALISMHSDSDAFARGCGRHLSKDAHAVVKAAASLLAGGEDANSPEFSQLSVSHIEEPSQLSVSSRTNHTRPTTPLKARPAAPTTARGTGVEAAASREAAPGRRSAAGSENYTREGTPTRRAVGHAEPCRREATPPRRAAARNCEVEAGSTRLAPPSKRLGSDCAEGSSTRIATPTRTHPSSTANVPVEAKTRLLTPRSATRDDNSAITPSESRIRPRAASPLSQNRSCQPSVQMAAPERTEAATPGWPGASPSPSPIAARSSSPQRGHFNKVLGDLIDPTTNCKNFKELSEMTAATMKERGQDSWDVDSLQHLRQTILGLLQKVVREDPPDEKFKGTLQLLDVFGEKPDWKHAEPGNQQVFSVIKEFLNLLNRKNLRKERVGEANMCFVKCLTCLHPLTAYWALLEVLKEEEKLKSLVIKCLKKVEKKASIGAEGCSEERSEREGRSIMEVVFSSRLSVLKLTGNARRQAWLEAAKEVVEIARRWLPEVVTDCFAATAAAAKDVDDRRLLEELLGRSLDENASSEQVPNRDNEACSKENVPIAADSIISKHGDLKTPMTSKPTSSPCVARNA